nr:hypothetical protein CFP56_39910 [Quercus suber]
MATKLKVPCKEGRGVQRRCEEGERSLMQGRRTVAGSGKRTVAGSGKANGHRLLGSIFFASSGKRTVVDSGKLNGRQLFGAIFFAGSGKANR